MNFREIRAKAREDIHRARGDKALYLTSLGATKGTRCIVRVHRVPVEGGTLQGTSFSYATIAEAEVMLRIDMTEITSPARDGVVVISETEAYRIDHVLDSDDGRFVSCPAKPLSGSDLVGLPVPGN